MYLEILFLLKQLKFNSIMCYDRCQCWRKSHRFNFNERQSVIHTKYDKID